MRRVFTVLIASLPFCLVTVQSEASAGAPVGDVAQWPAGVGMYFTGLLGKETRLQLRLKEGKGQYAGEYFYEQRGGWIALAGEAEGGRWVLREMVKSKVTGTLTLSAQGEGLAGEWKSADGLKQFPVRLELAARDLRVANPGPQMSSTEMTHPRFTGDTGVRFNAAVESVFMARHRANLAERAKQFAEHQRERQRDPALGVEWRWSFEDSAEIRYVSPDLISVRGVNYEYTGGAHPNTTSFPVNFWWRQGRAQEVALPDLFAANSDWRAQLGGVLRRELLRKKARYAVDGTAKVEDLLKPAAFTFSPEGIGFHYAPYEVGPYAQGAFDVMIPMATLQKLLRADGPLARWAR